jgi:predicted TIM-barrel fold metal-dependent hydrolase
VRPTIFDAHFHIIDPRFPLQENQGYLPDPFTVADYRRRTSALGIVGGVVVSGSFQGCDQGYLRDALPRLGPGFVGVTQLPPSVTDYEILALDAIGVRAVRFPLYRAWGTDIDDLVRLGRRVAEVAGWHVELYVDARDLAQLAPRLGSLPRIGIDHLGMQRDGLPALLDLVERGARVKATGFARTDHDVPAALRAITAVDPNALMFGTDLPSTRAPRPFADEDVDLVLDTLGEQVGRRVLYDNAIEWYRVRA